MLRNADLESALTIEPTNEAIKKELVEVKKVIEREKVQRKVKVRNAYFSLWYSLTLPWT